jgi:hypothetical protein
VWLNKRNFRTYDVIPLLTEVAQGAVKEKVIRVVVATFRVFDSPSFLILFLTIKLRIWSQKLLKRTFPPCSLLNYFHSRRTSALENGRMRISSKTFSSLETS